MKYRSLSPSHSSSGADRCGQIPGTDPDFVIIFEAIGNNVEVPLKVMASFVLQSFPGKCGDIVIGGNLESLADPSPIRKEEVALGITAFADDAFEDAPVVRPSNELEVNLEHVPSLFVDSERRSNGLGLTDMFYRVEGDSEFGGTFCLECVYSRKTGRKRLLRSCEQVDHQRFTILGSSSRRTAPLHRSLSSLCEPHGRLVRLGFGSFPEQFQPLQQGGIPDLLGSPKFVGRPSPVKADPTRGVPP